MPDTMLMDALEGIIETAAHAAETPPAPAQAVQESTERAGSAPLEELGRYQGEQLDPQILLAGEGYHFEHQRHMAPQYAQRLAEVATGYKAVIAGRRSLRGWFQESMMRADFPVLLGDTLDRLVLTRYATYAPTYRQFSPRTPHRQSGS